MNVLEAVTGFLRKVRELDTYGIRLYDTRYEESPCQLGITPGGISIFRRNRRIVFRDWEVVAEVSFKNKKLLVVLSSAGVCMYLHKHSCQSKEEGVGEGGWGGGGKGERVLILLL